MKTLYNAMQHSLVKILPGLLAMLALLNNGCATHASSAARGVKSSGGITGAEVGAIVGRVARHQIRSLQDREYPPADSNNSLEVAQDAAPPEGIAWAYPWGVTLYRMLGSV